jgi:hypothetical protein
VSAEPVQDFTVSTKIHRNAVFDLVTRRHFIPVHVRMSWDSADPFAVTLMFKTSRNSVVEWIVSRELLAEGLHFPAGEGDVRIAPDTVFPDESSPWWLNLTLNSPSGVAEFQVPADVLTEFLTETFAEMPPGCDVVIADEHFDEFLADCADEWGFA